jgi:DNA polymerase I-like protein with 3'-5' exonuclease and polymerase domains
MFQAALGAHDEILLGVPIEPTDQVVLTLKDTMDEAGRALLKSIPVETQVVVVGSWSEK